MRFVAFDVETTGLSKHDRVLEVACVTFQDGERRSIWQTLVNPGDGFDWTTPSVQASLKINRLRVHELRKAPTFSNVMENLFRCLNASVWVAHHADFDLRMLRQERVRADRETGRNTDSLVPRPRVIADTCSLDYALFPNLNVSRKLDAVADRYCLRFENAHTAVADAEACGRLFELMRPKLPQDLVELREFCEQAKSAYRKHRSERRR